MREVGWWTRRLAADPYMSTPTGQLSGTGWIRRINPPIPGKPDLHAQYSAANGAARMRRVWNLKVCDAEYRILKISERSPVDYSASDQDHSVDFLRAASGHSCIQNGRHNMDIDSCTWYFLLHPAAVRHTCSAGGRTRVPWNQYCSNLLHSRKSRIQDESASRKDFWRTLLHSRSTPSLAPNGWYCAR